MPINIMEAWPELRPAKLIDGRALLPRHKSKVWSKRDPSKIIGICNHQIAGNDNPVNTAAYHVKYFPAKTPGAPGLCYTFYVRKNGDIWWCNDIEDATWSQGDGKRPGSENDAFISIVSGGNFAGPGHSGGSDKLTDAQKVSLVELWSWLIKHLGLTPNDLFGHFHFSKPACPGYEITALMTQYATDHASPLGKFSTTWWQLALVKLGYSLGKTGPNKDGVDGDWGGKSRAALTKFQKDNRVVQTGYRDDITERVILHVLKEKNIVIPIT